MPWSLGRQTALRRFGALPVERKGEIIGIVTETDLLRYFAKTGGERPPEAEKLNPPKQKRRK